MSREHAPGNESEMLSCLYEFIEADLDEIKTLPLNDIGDELKSEGVDIEKIVDMVEQKIAKIKAQHILTHAHNQREECLKNLPDKLKSLFKTTGKKKLEIIREIKRVFDGSQEEVLAYCRKLEGVSAHDIETLLADLELLGQLSENIDEDRES